MNNLKSREQFKNREKTEYAIFYWKNLSGDLTLEQLPELSEGDNSAKAWT